MNSANKPNVPWTEKDSRRFIDVGRIYVPSRDKIRDTILDLIPAPDAGAFLVVELGVGDGWLSEAILERFPSAHILGLDVSPTMLAATEARLEPFAGRFELRPFALEDRSWLDEVDFDVLCFVSSLVIHHLDADGKQILYHDLYQHTRDLGAVLIADLVAPRSEWERRYMAGRWDAEVEKQSLAFTGSLDVYHRFVGDHWNWYEYPDPVDMPSTIPQHLSWLTAAGFSSVNVFWERAGHAVYGGYKGLSLGE